jgi:beta-glucosidase-like glycosyl hydrolase
MPHTVLRRLRNVFAVLLICVLVATCSSQDPGDGRTTPTADRAGGTTGSAAGRELTHDARVDEVLAGLDRREQVAQLFVVGVPLQDLGAGDALVRETGVGGVFLRGRSQASVEELAATTTRWASSAPGPLPWVAADQEGGAVQTLSGPGFAPLPPAVDQGRLPTDQLTVLANDLGSSLSGAGVNLDLAPVLDVVPPGTEAGNAPIGASGRQYGGAANAVVPAVRAVVNGLSAHGVTATLKHFPGLGRVQGNTDTTAHVTDDVTTRYDGQVAAFGGLARSPAHPFVMMSTATYTQIDGTDRAAFSRVVVTDLLRGQLGFRGVVISDDLGSALAVQDVGVGQRAVRFLDAGGTLVLTVEPATLAPMIDAVLARDAADPAFSAIVDGAVRTALLAKARAGLLPP